MTDLEKYRLEHPWKSHRCLGSDFRYRISVNPDSDVSVVIFTGAIGLSDLVFRQFMGLSKYYTVITFDYQKEYETVSALADAVSSLLKDLGIKAWFIGQSLGGIFAQITAQLHPEVVEGLVLSNTASLSLAMSEKAKNGVYRILMDQKKMRAIACLLPFSFYRRRTLSAMRGRNTEGLEEGQKKALDEFYQTTYDEVDKAYTIHMFNLIFSVKNHFGMIKSDFDNLDGKVYLLLAKDDMTYGKDDIDALVDLMPHPVLDRSMTGGNMAMIMNHEEYVEKVRAFIEERR